MGKAILTVSNIDLWLLIDRVHHSIGWVRRRELSPHNIAPQQLRVLRAIQALGSKVTLSALANEVERKVDVISRQAVILEKDGLIKRIKESNKSRLLRIELTEKGLDMLKKISNDSRSIEAIFSCLTEEERQQMYSILNRILKSKENASAKYYG